MKFLLKIFKYIFTGRTTSTGPCGFIRKCSKCGAPISYNNSFGERPRYDPSQKDK